MSTPRFVAVPDAVHSCCREATVLDTHMKRHPGDPERADHYKIVGEFSSMVDAQRVAKLLNEAEVKA